MSSHAQLFFGFAYMCKAVVIMVNVISKSLKQQLHYLPYILRKIWHNKVNKAVAKLTSCWTHVCKLVCMAGSCQGDISRHTAVGILAY